MTVNELMRALIAELAEEGVPDPTARTDSLGSYTEVSPSGTGLKCFLRGVLPPGRRSQGGIEMYDRGRYFAFTGRHLPGTPDTIEHRQAALTALHARTLGEAITPAGRHLGGGEGDTPSAAQIREMLRHIPPRGDYQDDWLRVLMAIHSAYPGPEGVALAEEWSPGYPGEIAEKFRSFKRDDGVGIGTLIHLARACGWQPPPGAVLIDDAGDGPGGDGDDGDEGSAANGSNRGRRSQASRLVELVADAELFHTPEGEPYAAIRVDGHREVWALRSRPFREWLSRRCYDAHRTAPGRSALDEALTVLAGQARYEGAEHRVHTRVAAHDGTIYLDLGDADWAAVEIDERGWRIVPDPPVRFRRSRGMTALPRPVTGGAITALRRFVNVPDEGWPLVVAYLLAALRPVGPYPVLALHGEQGSAKSTTAKALRGLVDPHTVPLRAEPRSVHDLAVAADNVWMLVFDNLSRLPGSLSDALCRLSTGGGLTTRELYSDRDEALFDAQRPVLLTGIPDLVKRSDLLDRAIVLHLPSIPPGRRRTEAAFWAEYERERPGILGALLDAVSAALLRLPTTTLPEPPRLADFALWGMAAEPALGWPVGTFLAAYTANREESNALALEASPVADAVRTLVERIGPWRGTATELLGKLPFYAPVDTTKTLGWPKTPQLLTGILRRATTNLREVGILVEERREHGGRRIITITQQQELHRHPSSPSPAPAAVPPPLTPSQPGLWVGEAPTEVSPPDGDDGDDGDDASAPPF